MLSSKEIIEWNKKAYHDVVMGKDTPSTQVKGGIY